MFSLRLSQPLFVLLLAILVTSFAFIGRSTLRPVDFWLYDTGLSLRPAHKPEDIVILGIDEKMMTDEKSGVKYHTYLAPRDKLAKLIENVSAGKPRAIALDVWLDSRVDEGANGKDEKLRNAFLKAKSLGVPVLTSDVALGVETEQASANSLAAGGSTIPFFKNAVTGVGNVLISADNDGTIRWHQKETSLDSPSLPFQMARLAGGKLAKAEQSNPDFQRFLTENAPIDYSGPTGTIDTQSASDFINEQDGLFKSLLLADKLVFIGATYPRSGDFQPTPYRSAKPMYGVEILAQATDSLRRRAPRHSHETTTAQIFDFSLVFLSALVVAFCALRGTAVGVLSAIGLIAVVGICALLSARDVTALWMFRFHPAAPFLLALPLAASGGIARRSLIQGRELKLVRDTFSAYMGDEILASLNGKMPELGGETRSIAVLFCDIRGYSALAESMSDDPKALLDELNAHFEPLVAALKRRGAYVDNYVGDLVMALFGAPFSTGDFESDTRAAMLAALDFIEVVEQRNQIRRDNGLLPIEVGIGVHCGTAVVGNLGSTDSKQGGKIHYTAIGDVVNVASRVESATRGQNVSLLVTREVVELSGKNHDLPRWQSLGEVAVKGRAAPVEIFKLADEKR